MLCSPLADEIALHSVFAKVVDLNVHLLTLALEWVFRDAWFLLGRVWPCVAASDGTAEACPPGEVVRTYGVGITQ